MVARRNPVVPRRTVRVCGGHPVQTTVTARPAVVRRWVYTTLWRQRRRLLLSAAGGGLTVGMGVQWNPLPPYRRLPAGAEHRPGTLQLCVGNRCLVIQLARLGGRGAVPQILRRFMADARVTFAGYYVASDCRKLRAHHGLHVESTLELCGAGGSAGRESMSRMAERWLGLRGVDRDRSEVVSRRSWWDAPKLSRAQVRYATVDAYISYLLGVYFRRRPLLVAAAERDEYYSSEAEYHYSDDDDDVVAPVYDEHCGGGWGGRFVGGFGERVSQDQLDDHVYDSICSSSSVY